MDPADIRLNGRTIRAVVLDFGEMLAPLPPPETIAPMARLLNIPPEDFWKHYAAARHPYDCGEISAEQYWSAIANTTGTRLTPEQIAWLRRTDVEMWSNVDPNLLRWAGELKGAGLRTGVISNMHADMAAAVRANSDWNQVFDCFVLSSELHMAKPDPQIFRHCLECLNVEPNETIFIDDREGHTRAARSIGIIGICANSKKAIREQLVAAGWEGPLPER